MMFEHVMDALPTMLSSFVTIMFLRSSGLLGKKKEKGEEKISFAPKNNTERVHMFLAELAKGNFIVADAKDLTYRTVSVEGLEEIELIWMGMWSQTDTIIIQKAHNKRYMYYNYEREAKKIKRLNDENVISGDLIKNTGLFDREWTTEEAQHFMYATQAVSEFCRNLLDFEKGKKERLQTHVNHLESHCQGIKPIAHVTKEGMVQDIQIPSFCQKMWDDIENLVVQIVSHHELSIEEKHNITRCLQQRNQLVMQYQNLSDTQKTKEEREIQAYLEKILHTLQTVEEEKLQINYLEFEKTKRIIQETH